jgi:hypothetical protein
MPPSLKKLAAAIQEGMGLRVVVEPEAIIVRRARRARPLAIYVKNSKRVRVEEISIDSRPTGARRPGFASGSSWEMTSSTPSDRGTSTTSSWPRRYAPEPRPPRRDPRFGGPIGTGASPNSPIRQ